jgi:hypothetical protein
VAQSQKKPWSTPRLRRFETSAELEAFYGAAFTDAEANKLVELLKHMQRTHPTIEREARPQRFIRR